MDAVTFYLEFLKIDKNLVALYDVIVRPVENCSPGSSGKMICDSVAKWTAA
jgi:hypothetical protein